MAEQSAEPTSPSSVQDDGTDLGPESFRVGEAIMLNGMTLHIYDADPFTRLMYPDQPPAQQPPAGVYEVPPFEGTPSTARNGGPRVQPCHNVDHHRPALLFYGSWDDTGRELGEQHWYKLWFYTETNEIEVKEVGSGAADMPCVPSSPS